MVYIFLGPSGCGKGTQAELLSKRLGLPAFSMGEIFREELEKGTVLGKAVAVFMKKGVWVPNKITCLLLKRRLDKETRGFILDAIPRRIGQARWLDAYLGKRKMPLKAVIHLETPDEIAIKRVAERVRGGKEERIDETPETIQKRLRSYRETIRPILDYYRKRGILVEVNNEGGIKEVYQEVLKRLGLFGGDS